VSRAKPYVGKTPAGEYRVFRSDVTPTEETHGYNGQDGFVVAYGPFRTVAAAYGWANFHTAIAGQPLTPMPPSLVGRKPKRHPLTDDVETR
jgi:hypothetical protein